MSQFSLMVIVAKRTANLVFLGFVIWMGRFWQSIEKRLDAWSFHLDMSAAGISRYATILMILLSLIFMAILLSQLTWMENSIWVRCSHPFLLFLWPIMLNSDGDDVEAYGLSIAFIGMSVISIAFPILMVVTIGIGSAIIGGLFAIDILQNMDRVSAAIYRWLSHISGFRMFSKIDYARWEGQVLEQHHGIAQSLFGLKLRLSIGQESAKQPVPPSL